MGKKPFTFSERLGKVLGLPGHRSSLVTMNHGATQIRTLRSRVFTEGEGSTGLRMAGLRESSPSVSPATFYIICSLETTAAHRCLAPVTPCGKSSMERTGLQELFLPVSPCLLLNCSADMPPWARSDPKMSWTPVTREPPSASDVSFKLSLWRMLCGP